MMIDEALLRQSLNGDPMGRLYIPDERDVDYPLRAAPVPLSADEEEIDKAVERGWRYWWQDGWWGDQWYTPQCVAYAWTHVIEDGPVTHEALTPSRVAARDEQGSAIIRPSTFYRQAQDVDQWPGHDYEGTSVRAGAQVLRTRGLIGNFYWAWTVENVADTVLKWGPGVAGTWWHYNMFDPDEDGVITLGGGLAGGHAFDINGVNYNTEMFRIKQSYGRQHGKDGNLYISFEDMDVLMAEQGEFCFVSEINA